MVDEEKANIQLGCGETVDIANIWLRNEENANEGPSTRLRSSRGVTGRRALRVQVGRSFLNNSAQRRHVVVVFFQRMREAVVAVAVTDEVIKI